MTELAKPDIVSLLLDSDSGRLTRQARTDILPRLDANADRHLSSREITTGIAAAIDALERAGVRNTNPAAKGAATSTLTTIAGLIDERNAAQYVYLLRSLAPSGVAVEMLTPTDIQFIRRAAREASIKVTVSTDSAAPEGAPYVPPRPTPTPAIGNVFVASTPGSLR